MGDFKKFGKKGDTFNRGPGGKPSFNSRPGPAPRQSFSGFNRGGELREMFKTTCTECGKPAEVPFRPSGDRPVYCKDCFAAMGPQDRGDRPDRGPSNFQRRDTAPRPNFTPRPSFAPAQGSGEDKRLDDLKIQLATVISKLDKLINLQSNTSTAHTTPKIASFGTSETLQETIAKVASKAKAPAKKKSSSKKK